MSQVYTKKYIECTECDGKGYIEDIWYTIPLIKQGKNVESYQCAKCKGTGKEPVFIPETGRAAYYNKCAGDLKMRTLQETIDL